MNPVLSKVITGHIVPANNILNTTAFYSNSRNTEQMFSSTININDPMSSTELKEISLSDFSRQLPNHGSLRNIHFYRKRT